MVRKHIRLGVFAMLGAAAVAQIGTSTISGRVTDPTGAAIPGVSIVVTNAATSFEYTSETNAEGLFRVQSLQPGMYRVAFVAKGFKKLVRENVVLRSGVTVPVDAALEIGSVTEAIDVTATSPLLETETATTGSVIEGSTLYKLPIYQRLAPATFYWVPGMTHQGFSSGSSLAAFHVAGQRAGAIGMFEDGVPGNDQTSGTGNVRPIQNSVAETKVLTTALPAEYGHSAGGVLSVVKKTGTNQFEGMASFYGRGRRMEHRGFFDMYKNSQPTPLSPRGTPSFFLMPDAYAGGPVMIPKLYDGRNRTFFLLGWEKLIEKKTNQALGTVPTPAMFAGDFSFGGMGNPLYDPLTTRQLANGNWTRDPFPASSIPVARIDPVARKVLQMQPWHAPNLPGSFNAAGPVDNLLYDSRSNVTWNHYNARVDQQFSTKIKIYWSYTYNHQTNRARPANIRIPEFDGANVDSFFTYQNHSIGGNWLFSPTKLNDLRIGYYRRLTWSDSPSFGKGYGNILGIPNISADLLPAFGTGGANTADSIYGLTVTGPSREVGETITFRDDFSVLQGAHAFKMGYELLRNRDDSTNVNRPSGDFRFDLMTAGLQATGNAVPRTGNTFAGFLLGTLRQAMFDQELASWLPRSSNHSVYVQDDWKVTTRLTLNLGVRYTNESPYSTKYGQQTTFDPAAKDDVSGRVGAFVHPKGSLSRRDNNNFQPRVGLAWHPLQKFVFRGGFAVNTVDVRWPTARGQFEEYIAQANQQRAPGDPRPLYQISAIPEPVRYNIRPDGTSGFIGTNYSARNGEWYDTTLRNPYVLNWNLSIQCELQANYVVEIMYQGSAAVGLLERWEVNTFPVDFGKDDPALRTEAFRAAQNYRPFPHFGSVRFRSNFGHSTYHSGTVKLEKRYSKGLVVQGFYTVSKAINSQDTDNAGSGVAPIQNRSLEKARAGYDRTHVFATNFTYELPFGSDRALLNRRGPLTWILGGWDIGFVGRVDSGNPLTFTFRNSPYNYFPSFVGDARPNVTGAPEIRDNWRDFGGDRFNSQNINPVVDISHFSYPAAFTPGTSGRNNVTGLGMIGANGSLSKSFRFTERLKAQLRLDYNNLFKYHNFAQPTTVVDLQNPKTFGKVTAGPTTASWGGIPLMNLSLKFIW